MDLSISTGCVYRCKICGVHSRRVQDAEICEKCKNQY